MHFLKKSAFFLILGGIFYFVLSHHFIVINNSVKLLKKSTLTLNYTIFSTKAKSLDSILSVKELWDDGIGELLVETGKMSEDALERYRDKKEAQD